MRWSKGGEGKTRRSRRFRNSGKKGADTVFVRLKTSNGRGRKNSSRKKSHVKREPQKGMQTHERKEERSRKGPNRDGHMS